MTALRSMRSYRAAVALGAVALTLAWTLAMGAAEWETCGSPLSMPEGSSLSTEVAWWPPGATACEYTSPTGDVRRYTDFPATQWRGIVAFALAMALAALAATRSRRQGWLAAGSVLALAGALSVFVV